MNDLMLLGVTNILVGAASIAHRHWVQVILPRRHRANVDPAPRLDMPLDNQMSMQRRAVLAQDPTNEDVERPKPPRRVAPEGL